MVTFTTKQQNDPVFVQRELDKRLKLIRQYEAGRAPERFSSGQYERFKQDVKQLREYQARFVYPEAERVEVPDIPTTNAQGETYSSVDTQNNALVSLPAQATTTTQEQKQQPQAQNQQENTASLIAQKQKIQAQNTETEVYVTPTSQPGVSGVVLAGQGTTPRSSGDIYSGPFLPVDTSSGATMSATTGKEGDLSQSPLTLINGDKITGSLDYLQLQIEENKPSAGPVTQFAYAVAGVGISFVKPATALAYDLLPIGVEGPKVPLKETATGFYEMVSNPGTSAQALGESFLNKPAETTAELAGGYYAFEGAGGVIKSGVRGFKAGADAVLKSNDFSSYTVVRSAQQVGVPIPGMKATDVYLGKSQGSIPTEYPGNTPFINKPSVVVSESGRDVLRTPQGDVSIYEKYGLRRGEYDLQQTNLFGEPIPTSIKKPGVLPLETVGYDTTLAEGLTPSSPGYLRSAQQTIAPQEVLAVDLTTGTRYPVKRIGTETYIEMKQAYVDYDPKRFILTTESPVKPRGSGIAQAKPQELYGDASTQTRFIDTATLSGEGVVYYEKGGVNLINLKTQGETTSAPSVRVNDVENVFMNKDNGPVRERTVVRERTGQAVTITTQETTGTTSLTELGPVRERTVVRERTSEETPSSPDTTPANVPMIEANARGVPATIFTEKTQYISQPRAVPEVGKASPIYVTDTISTTRQDNAQLQAPAIVVAFKEDYRQDSRQNTRSQNIIITREDVVQFQAQEQINQSAQDRITIQEPIPQRDRFSYRPSPRPEKPPKEPFIKEPFIKILKPKEEPSSPGSSASVSVRRGGKFRVIASGLTTGEAIDFGRNVVESTAGVTFKISGPDTATIEEEAGSRLPFGRFYSGKEQGTYLQRNKYRISSAGERAEITLKGAQAKRNKKRKGFF